MAMPVDSVSDKRKNACAVNLMRSLEGRPPIIFWMRMKKSRLIAIVQHPNRRVL